MWRCSAALERIDAGQKASLGESLVKELGRPNLSGYVAFGVWAAFAARVPLYGPANTAVELGRRPSGGTTALLGRSFATGREVTDAIFAFSQLARVSGDRARDLDEALRLRVLGRMAELGADETALRPVREYHDLEAAQQGQALGDALPVGLRLVRPSQVGEGG